MCFGLRACAVFSMRVHLVRAVTAQPFAIARVDRRIGRPLGGNHTRLNHLITAVGGVVVSDNPSSTNDSARLASGLVVSTAGARRMIRQPSQPWNACLSTQMVSGDEPPTRSSPLVTRVSPLS